MNCPGKYSSIGKNYEEGFVSTLLLQLDFTGPIHRGYKKRGLDRNPARF
jgi:hypothetical protein